MVSRELPTAPAILDRRATIVVLAHRIFGLEAGTTLAIIAREYWQPQGYRIVLHCGLKIPPPADLAIQHVPLTRVPQRYADLSACYPRTINGAVTDVSKRRVATDLVSKVGPYDGPVMVKTDLNHAGIAERRLRRAKHKRWAPLLSAVERRLPCHWFGGLPGDKYLVFARKSEVPGWVWRCSGLVVQPFHVERRGEFYALHQWYFLGDHDCVSTFLSREPMVKLANVVERLPLHRDVPDAIRRRRVELGFDYGKFDYVISEGVPILLDANHTPNEGLGEQKNPRVLAICGMLAGGLVSFVP